MLIVKEIELRRGEYLVLPEVRQNAEVALRARITAVRAHFSLHFNRTVVAAFFSYLADSAFSSVRNAYNALQNMFRAASDWVRGKQLLKNRGAVSFFLKDILDSKSRSDSSFTKHG